MQKEEDNDLNGIIRIGIYSHISLFMLPNVMKEFIKKHPCAKFNIYSGSHNEMIEKLRNNELDFIVMQYPIFINDSKFKEEILCDLETCFFTNKYYCDLYLSNKSLTEMPIILPMRGFADITKLEEKLKEYNIILKHNLTCYTNELTKELVHNGMGIGQGIKKIVENDIKNGELYELKLDFKSPSSKFSIAYDDKYLNKTTKEFIRIFKKMTKDNSIDCQTRLESCLLYTV